MKYAVIYQSKSGNTKMIAYSIYRAICSSDKGIFDLDQMAAIPEAEVYFVGFAVHNNSCGMDVINLLEEMEDKAVGAKYALFLTCGYSVNDQYKNNVLRNLKTWLPESAVLIDIFLCQGKVEKDRQNIMISHMPANEDKLRKMFDLGKQHPDDRDLEQAYNFAMKVQAEAEKW